MDSERPVRAAVIGLGQMGGSIGADIGLYARWQAPHSHAACYVATDGVELVGGADPHAEQRENFGHNWGLSRDHVYEDYREMLARERPDVVSICTSAKPRAHILLDVVAANAGVRAIWAEKPIAISLAEADQMVAACQKAGILLAIGASRCWDATYNRMRELIDQGEIGDVLQVVALGESHLSHNGSHLLTLVRYLAGGDCVWASGYVADDGPEQGDDDFMGNGYLQFDNGAQAFIRSMPCGAAYWEFDVIGTLGRLRAIGDGEEVEFWRLSSHVLDGRRGESARHVFPPIRPMDTANMRTVKDLLDGLATGKEPTCNGVAGRQVLEIAIALRESHRRGGARVELPLVDRSLRINSRETQYGDDPRRIQRRRSATESATSVERVAVS